MAKIAPDPEKMPGSGAFIKYHQRMWKDIKLLERITSELDEMSSVDVMLDWYKSSGGEGLSRSYELKTLLESFEKGIIDHFNEETAFIRKLGRNENLAELVKRLLRDHRKFTEELGSLKGQLNNLLTQGPGPEENLETWKQLLLGLRDLLKRIGDHAMQEQEIIFKLGHNM